MEEPEMGDRWTYEIRDQIAGELRSTVTSIVTDVSAKEIGMRLTFLGNTERRDGSVTNCSRCGKASPRNGRAVAG
jgi:hypothetical protein